MGYRPGRREGFVGIRDVREPRAVALLPRRRAQVAELLLAPARHVEAPLVALDEVPARGATLPALRAAERLLSRTLMNAWVDGEGDMSSELGTFMAHLDPTGGTYLVRH